MKEGQISSPRPVALIGGGPVRRCDLDRIVAEAEFLVAADGGADSAIELGHPPAWIVGDLDSVSGAARARVGADRVLHDTDQDTTDFEKCLAQISAPLVLAAGFLGARVDHQLAVFNSLVRQVPGSVVLVGAHDVCLHLPTRLTLDLVAGDRVSLFPLAQVSGRSEGLAWNIKGLTFAPHGKIGTSNRADGTVALEFDDPGMVLIVDRGRLNVVLAALAGR